MAPPAINWAIYNSLPPEEAQYQLENIHDSKRKSMAVAYIICYSISFTAVILRFISRRIGRIPYGADDWFIVLAQVGSQNQSTCVEFPVKLTGLQLLAAVSSVASILGQSIMSNERTSLRRPSDLVVSHIRLWRRTACDLDERR